MGTQNARFTSKECSNKKMSLHEMFLVLKVTPEYKFLAQSEIRNFRLH